MYLHRRRLEAQLAQAWRLHGGTLREHRGATLAQQLLHTTRSRRTVPLCETGQGFVVRAIGTLGLQTTRAAQAAAHQAAVHNHGPGTQRLCAADRRGCD